MVRKELVFLAALSVFATVLVQSFVFNLYDKTVNMYLDFERMEINRGLVIKTETHPNKLSKGSFLVIRILNDNSQYPILVKETVPKEAIWIGSYISKKGNSKTFTVTGNLIEQDFELRDIWLESVIVKVVTFVLTIAGVLLLPIFVKLKSDWPS